MNIKTATLCDEFEEQLQAADPIFKTFGDKTIFSGEIITLKVFEENGLIKKTLDGLGKKRVLVIDGGGSLQRALIDENLAELAIRNAWEGIIVYGCIRDSDEINTMDIGIKAINSCPLNSKEKNNGEKNITVRFAGLSFVPGQHIYADNDGILISEKKLI